MSNDLQLLVDSLPLREKVELREYLSDQIKESRKYGQSPLRCSILMGEMAAALGWREIPYHSRESHHVWARTMVAYQMLKEGYRTTEVGRQMEKDHSSVCHMRDKMMDVFALPQAYGDILEMWEKFQKQIDNDIHEGTTTNPVGLGGELPDGDQSEMGEESGEDSSPGDL